MLGRIHDRLEVGDEVVRPRVDRGPFVNVGPEVTEADRVPTAGERHHPTSATTRPAPVTFPKRGVAPSAVFMRFAEDARNRVRSAPPRGERHHVVIVGAKGSCPRAHSRQHERCDPSTRALDVLRITLFYNRPPRHRPAYNWPVSRSACGDSSVRSEWPGNGILKP